MITHDTVFILGAGASKPYGFPTAWELKLDIIKNFHKRIQKIISGYNSYLGNYEQVLTQFINHFRDSHNVSIDLFLSRNPLFSSIGKDAIVLSLLESEKSSLKYWFKEDISIDWYLSIFNYMLDGLFEPEDYKIFGQNKTTFITFNYDRSLENYLYNSLLNTFSKASEDEIKEVMRKISIHHVYGELGHLPWERNSIDPSNSAITFIDYGKSEIYYPELEIYRKSIKTIKERLPLQEGEPIFEALQNAMEIFFLGFSFGDENMEILKDAIMNIPRFTVIHLTTLGLSEKKIKDIWKRYFKRKDDTHQSFEASGTFIPEQIDSNALLIKRIL
ncbi:MAG: SIR2 family protein [Ignavibacteriaceae bacterium]